MLPVSLASVVGHTLHYGLLVAGFVGVGALLLGSVSRESPAARPTLVGAVPSGAWLGSPDAAEATAAPARRPVVWPVAIVSSTAAAGVHAAMGPAHAAESELLGLLFAAAALGQLAWAGLALRRAPTSPGLPTLAAAGLVLHGTVLAAWALSRTVGLPGLEGPEPVGAWDSAAVVWQLVAVAACLWVLATGAARPLSPGVRWNRGALGWAALSVLALPILVLATSAPGGGV